MENSYLPHATIYMCCTRIPLIMNSFLPRSLTISFALFLHQEDVILIFIMHYIYQCFYLIGAKTLTSIIERKYYETYYIVGFTLKA